MTQAVDSFNKQLDSKSNFDLTFPDIALDIYKQERDYKLKMASSKEETAKIRDDYSKIFEDFATKILERDKELFSSDNQDDKDDLFWEEQKTFLKNNTSKLISENKIKLLCFPSTCLICGKKIPNNEIFIAIDGHESESIHLDCSDSKLRLNNNIRFCICE